MKKLLCVILALPLVVFGVENALDSADSTDLTRKGTNIKTFDSVGAKSGNTASKMRTRQILLNDNETKEPSGFMLGAGLTLGGLIDMRGDEYMGYAIDNSRFEYGGELMLGYKWFFGERGIFGMRLYADYNFLFSTDGINPVDAHNGSLNYDFMFNFNQYRPFKVGIFFGIHTGAGATNYKYDRLCEAGSWSSWDGVNGHQSGTNYELCSNPEINLTFGGNFGLRFVIYDRSAIELAVQPRYEIFENDLHILGMTRFIYTF